LHKYQANIPENNSLKTANKTCNLVALINNFFTNLVTVVETYVSYVHAVAAFSILINKLIRVSSVFITII